MKKAKTTTALTEINNSMESVNQLLNLGGAFAQLSKKDTLYLNNRWNFISNDRQLLSQIYVEHGIVQTLIDQPVEDAFRTGLEVKSGELDAEDLEKLEIYIENNNVIKTLMQAMKWARLYGGGAVMVVTNQDPASPFEIDKITEKTRIAYKAVDMWELYTTTFSTEQGYIFDEGQEYYMYYGRRVHKSRVYRVEGKEAPSFLRPQLRGWGMSVVERLVRSLNQYLKNQDVIFELLDEAKVDVYKMKGFNTSLMTSQGSAGVARRIQNANMVKNYNNAIVMDTGDEYEQKTMTFTGLAEMLIQIRQGIAADLRMPVTKLFGISSAGFSSGEDEIENYNAMVESEIRSKCKGVIVDLLGIACQKEFGFIPDDLQLEFESLRIMSSKEEEEVKTSQFNRVMAAYTAGLIEDVDAKAALNRDSLLPVEIDEDTPANEPLGAEYSIKNPPNFEAKTNQKGK
jgi:phage-related protein (TIGR01555 family)